MQQVISAPFRVQHVSGSREGGKPEGKPICNAVLSPVQGSGNVQLYLDPSAFLLLVQAMNEKRAVMLSLALGESLDESETEQAEGEHSPE